MSDNSFKPESTKLRPEVVADYLRKHPYFFNDYPDLVADMHVNHDSGKAVSLVERQVSILRERNIEMRQRLSNLLDTARENDQLFAKTRRLVLALVECVELGDMVDALYYSFQKEFNVHYTRLILFGPHVPPSLARIETVNKARDFIGKRLKSPHAVSGGIDIKETQFLFDDDAQNVGSAALAVLSYGNPLGVLAIGNQDPNYYRSSMGTLFLGYIAEVLNRILPSLIHQNR